MLFNKNTVEPMYIKIADYLEEKIRSGELGVGDKIYTEVELMEMFDVSRITVRQAIKILLDKGLVERKQGKGTFVKNNQIYYQLHDFKGFYKSLIDQGVNPETELTKFKILKASGITAKALRLEIGEKVTEIHRIYYVDSIPVAFTKMYVPPKYAKYISKEEAERFPILDIITLKSGCKIGKVHFEIFSNNCSKEISEKLNLNERSAVLCSERILYSTENEPIEFALSWYRSDFYRYSIDLQGSSKSSRSEVYEFKIKTKK